VEAGNGAPQEEVRKSSCPLTSWVSRPPTDRTWFEEKGHRKLGLVVSVLADVPAAPVTIESLAPAEGYPGDELEIRGSGFTRTSRVTIAGVAAPTVYVARDRLVARIPLGGTAEAPEVLGLGEVPVTADGSEATPLNLLPLPDDPHPPGEVFQAALAELRSTAIDLVPLTQASFDLLGDQKLTPDQARLLDALQSVLPELGPMLNDPAIDELATQGNASALPLFERLLLAKLGDPMSSTAPLRTHSTRSGWRGVLESCSDARLDGEAWIALREPVASRAHRADKFTDAVTLFCVPLTLALPAAGPTCARLALGGTVTNLALAQAVETCGLITELSITLDGNPATQVPISYASKTVIATITTQNQWDSFGSWKLLVDFNNVVLDYLKIALLPPALRAALDIILGLLDVKDGDTPSVPVGDPVPRRIGFGRLQPNLCVDELIYINVGIRDAGDPLSGASVWLKDADLPPVPNPASISCTRSLSHSPGILDVERGKSFTVTWLPQDLDGDGSARDDVPSDCRDDDPRSSNFFSVRVSEVAFDSLSIV